MKRGRTRGPDPANRPTGPAKPGLDARKAAARLLAAVIDAKTSLDGLTDPEHGHPQFRALAPRDQGLVRAILVTALRHRIAIETAIAAELDRPLPANATALSHLMHVGAAQLLYLDVPASAAVDLAVSHAHSDPRTERFAGLVNAVLRKVARRRGDAALGAGAAPAWLEAMLVSAYGADATATILAAQAHEAPIDVTVRDDPAGWAERLGGFLLPNGSIRLAGRSEAIPSLPGFDEGVWWVQDAAASFPARMLGDFHGKRVADLCAAPGGKTAQLAVAGARVTALDASASRMKRLRANMGRLGLDVEMQVADLRGFAPAEPFDAVLLDAPCSSTGTIRRHPDIPWTKDWADVERLAEVQYGLLERAATLVRPGGTIVFSNCSLAPVEGEELVARFLRDHAEILRDPLVPGEIAGADEFLTAEGDLRTTPAGYDLGSPERSGLDGFYAARLRRKA